MDNHLLSFFFKVSTEDYRIMSAAGNPGRADVQIQIIRNLQPVFHEYPDFSITLYPFVCSIDGDEPRLHEHASVLWLPPEELSRLDWADSRPTGAGGLLAIRER